MMAHYLSLFVRAVFVENMALAFFLGCVPSLRCRKSLHRLWPRRSGDGGARLSVPMNNLIYNLVLRDGALVEGWI
jgi:Na+-transporting NADH:ubiquinone oxidoreductase subunit E